MRNKGLSNRVVSVRGQKHIQTAEICSYSLQKGIITRFELFFEGHSERCKISGSFKSSHFLFLIIARLICPFSIRIYGTHVTYYL